MNKIDYDSFLGKQINHFIVTEIIKRASGASFKVKCQCGIEKIYSANRIITNHCKSCGCKHWGNPRLYLKGRPAHNKENLTGQKFGKLTVKEIDPNHALKKASWICHCECGQTKIVRAINLKLGHTKSCGCDTFKRTDKHASWTGYGELSGSEWSKITNGAEKRNIEITLTIEQAWKLFIKQNGKCAISGLELKLKINSSKGLSTASLDRIDSTKGYTLENSQWVHKNINIMKNTLDQKQFVSYCYIITNNNQHIFENKNLEDIISEIGPTFIMKRS